MTGDLTLQQLCATLAVSESDIGEYDEATDAYYDPEGWYECIDNWGDYSSVFVSQQITHWMPLPAAPEAPKGTT